MPRASNKQPRVTSQRATGRSAPGSSESPDTGGASPALREKKRSYERLILAAILLVGLGLRVAYLSENAATPEFSAPAVDPGFHDYWARGIATGDWRPPSGQPDPKITTTPYLRPPGYPYFLALLYKVAGPGYLAPRLIQIVLGLINVGLAFTLTRRWFGGPVALICAALMSTYWILLYFEGQLQAPTLLIFLFLGGVHLLSRWSENNRWYYALFAGVVFGLAAVVRPNALSLVAAGVVWMLWVGYRRSRQRRAISIAALILGAVLPIAPVTIRNYVVAKDYVPISANAGVNLFIGNNENADGFFFGHLSGLGEFGTCYDYPRIVRRVEMEVGRPLKYSEVSSYFSDRALDYVKEHPGHTLLLLVKKAILFWGPHEISHNRVIHYDRAFATTLRNIPGNFPLVMSIFILGMVLLAVDLRCAAVPSGETSGMVDQRRRVAVLIVLLVVFYFLSYLPFFNTARYRVPLLPFLFLFGAYGLFRLGQFIGRREFRRVVGWGAIWLAAYGLARMPLVPYTPDLAEWLFARGAAHHRLGELDAAATAFRDSLWINPHEPRTHCNLALTLAEAGRPEEAIAAWTEALRVWPDCLEAHNDLGNLLLQLGRVDEAGRHYSAAVRLEADFPAPYNNLANLLAGRGHFADALELYHRALRLDPDAAEAHLGLGLLLARTGDLPTAVEHYREALRRRPDLPEVYINLGLALKEQGRVSEAIEHYAAALRLRPQDARTYHNLGVALQESGRIDEALEAYETALELEPKLALTHRRLGQILFERERLPEAQEHLSAARRLRPDDVAATYILAQVLEKQGDLVGAVEVLETVLRLEPNHAEASRKLESLRGGRSAPQE